ncbi:MAG: TfoX/Sxy family DNA transformation protein [Paracoccus sp. (in: a-proteobacteria)]|nr:TfoX/Sxy family DNA transformation protein [Paracoccus sp. (in: a-proteobacteria)]
MSELTTIRNIGPAMARDLVAAGVPDAETLRALGADAAYARMLSHGTRPHFIGYYVLHMGLQGRPWNDCKGAEKDALRARFDALVSGEGSAARIEAALDQIGLPRRR